MYRAIYNLLINCVEHNPSGTEIDVVLTQKSDEIYININDNGIGINPETLNDIFAKYYSSKTKILKIRG